MAKTRKGKKGKTNAEIAAEVTAKILAQLNEGVVPWHKPWAGSGPKNLTTKKEYRGINVLLLEMSRIAHGYGSNYWLTFRQAKSKGGHVRKGEHGEQIVFWKFIEREVETDDGEKEAVATVRLPLMRMYTVFNVEQCEEIEAPEDQKTLDRVIGDAELIVSRYKSDGAPPVKHDGGSRAFYRPATDEIHMPEKTAFKTAEHYYSTLFHEHGHGTGHKTRLNRKGIAEHDYFGSDVYSEEELVAEFTAAYLMGRVGGEYVARTIQDSASYIDHWKGKLRDDGKLIVRVTSAAQRAMDWILGERGGERESE